jgi:hypothetical protein
MSKGFWTPGPWEFQQRRDKHVRVYAAGFGQIADFKDYLGEVWAVQAPANARLITHAPDLYAVVEMLTLSIVTSPLTLARFDPDEVAAALAVLRAARGEALPEDVGALAKARGESQ